MHISETIITKPPSSPADWQTATTKTVEALAREVAAYPGKTYLSESRNAFFSHNPFWQHERFRFTPTLKAPSHIGMVYRGDSRPPETIFTTGFNQKSNNSDFINDNDFLAALLNTQLSPYNSGLRNPKFLSVFAGNQLVNNPKNGFKTRIQEKIENPHTDQCIKAYTAAFLPPLDPVNRTHSISLSICAEFEIFTDQEDDKSTGI